MQSSIHRGAVHGSFDSTIASRAASRVCVRCRAYDSTSNGARMAPVERSKAQASSSTPSKLPKMSFFKAMMFNGPAPELINGRIAMLAFIIASLKEAGTGEMFLDQMMHAPVQQYLGMLLWVYASMVPIMHNARMEPFGIFTPKAEVTNGRAAMLGFACILALEYKFGVPFF